MHCCLAPQRGTFSFVAIGNLIHQKKKKDIIDMGLLMGLWLNSAALQAQSNNTLVVVEENLGAHRAVFLKELRRDH